MKFHITAGLCLLFFTCIFSTARAQEGQAVYFASDPAVTPDGQSVVFTYESDLWKVPAEGGNAVRLTGMDGVESAASISPDGQWLAFSSTQYGNGDVYLMPMDGGEIRQLTWHQADDQVEGWSWDSGTIWFRSGRLNSASVYGVSVEGGTPQRLFGHYHNTVHNLAEHPSSGEYYFNESWESNSQVHRKGYRGSFNPDIKSYHPGTQEYRNHTDWEGKDLWPMFDRSGTLWFVSDEANGEYNLYTLENGQKQPLTRFDSSIGRPAVSADGSTIVYERDYRLFSWNVALEEEREISVTLPRNNTLAREQSFSTEGEVESFDVSGDKKKLAFVSRGELFVSDAEGRFIRRIDTDPMGRVLEVKWLKDNRTLLFNQTVEGYQNWFTVPADGSGRAEQHTDDRQNNRMLALNGERTQGVYLSGRNELRLIDLESLESRTIVEDEFWGFQNEQPRFSPDESHILYTARRDFEHDLLAWNSETDESVNLTETGISESDPFWSPDGKYIWFASSRVRPSYPRGSGETDLYRMALDNYDEPYRSDHLEQLFVEEDTAANRETDQPAEVTINRKGLMERLEQVGPGFGSQSSPYVVRDDEKTHILYLSNHDEGSTSLWITTLEPFESPQTRKVEGVSYVSSITEVDGQLYGLSGGSIHKLDIDNARATEITTDHDFKRNLRSEFNQMFEELWANVEENFYNETFHGRDWREIRDRYRMFLPYVSSRSDFERMMNDMLGELNSSHMGFSTSGDEEEEFYSTVTLAPGLLFEEDNPWVVRHIVREGPADVAGVDIRPGDRLTAVDGTPVSEERNREEYFARPSMEEELTLTFSRGGETVTEKIHPASYGAIRTRLYDEWVDQNQQTVDEQTDRRVAYVHMKNMGGGELENFLIEMTSEAYHRDGLILDLRYNTGGNVHNDVLQFLSQRIYAEWKYRNGDPASQPNFTPASKPIVLLQNEQSLSDAEVTAAGFRELGLGTIVGNESYRWIIFTSGKGLVDGSFYRLPSWGLYTLSGENLEETGVAPDIEVDNTFLHRLKGEDPQLDRAIKEVLRQMNGNG